MGEQLSRLTRALQKHPGVVGSLKGGITGASLGYELNTSSKKNMPKKNRRRNALVGLVGGMIAGGTHAKFMTELAKAQAKGGGINEKILTKVMMQGSQHAQNLMKTNPDAFRKIVREMPKERLHKFLQYSFS